MTSPPAHDRSAKKKMTTGASDDDGEAEDPVERMISRTGCAELHEALQDCMAEHQDWRVCQSHVGAFKKCMSDYHKARQELLSQGRRTGKTTST
ncbi:cytochrome c oxidase assembly factor 4 homolog, mitochondrial [Syngnathoides biaculeatus]|uniref:cytochrome c oxidase assembly factor 4 homolog, mitochondrial n=1 Tax=Syngnathoides biaculeatus TaxID=300417 RepID=UPI002ADE4700|nr:cytochrome c oxidase assembly factor 4 homolog, mitochondrial [Syngnathoides biaculeatus]